MRKLKAVMLIDDDPISNCLNENLLRSSDQTGAVTTFSNTENALAYFSTLDNNLEILESIIPEIVILHITRQDQDINLFLPEFEKFSETLKSGVRFVILHSSSLSTHINIPGRVFRIMDNLLSEKSLIHLIKTINQDHYQAYLSKS